jgi:hypothetical protein
MCAMGADGDVEGIKRLLDEGMDPAALEECSDVSRGLVASTRLSWLASDR